MLLLSSPPAAAPRSTFSPKAPCRALKPLTNFLADFFCCLGGFAVFVWPAAFPHLEPVIFVAGDDVDMRMKNDLSGSFAVIHVDVDAVRLERLYAVADFFDHSHHV